MAVKRTLRPGVKSPFRIDVAINKNFVIRVLENPKDSKVSMTRLTTAKNLSKFLKDEELKMKLFKKVLQSGKDKYTFLIRNRLKIDFCSK